MQSDNALSERQKGCQGVPASSERIMLAWGDRHVANAFCTVDTNLWNGDVSEIFMTNSDDDLSDPLIGPSWGPSFLEKLITALVDGHMSLQAEMSKEEQADMNEKSRDQRIRDAMFAISGVHIRGGKKTQDDTDLLRHMALLDYKDKIQKGIGSTAAEEQPLSARALAKLAINDTGLIERHVTGEDVTIKRLSTKYKESRTGLLGLEIYDDDIVNSVEHQILTRIGEELKKAEIPFEFEDL